MNRFQTKIVLLLLFAVLLAAAQVCLASSPKDAFMNNHPTIRWQAAGDRWWAVDKYRHLIASAFLLGLSYNVARCEGGLKRPQAIYLGCSFSLSLGIAKEWRDAHQPGNYASLKDLVADIFGIGLGILCLTDHLKF